MADRLRIAILKVFFLNAFYRFVTDARILFGATEMI